jgi:hypothetical protein
MRYDKHSVIGKRWGHKQKRGVSMKWDSEAPIPWEHPYLQPDLQTATPGINQRHYGHQTRRQLANEWSNALLYTLPLQQMGTSGARDEGDDAGSWLNLALSVVHQAVRDAARGDPDALAWLLSEGKHWLEGLDISPLIVDAWAADL